MTNVQPRMVTIDELMRVDGKAELIGGRIVRFKGTGKRPGLIGKRITRSLDDFLAANRHFGGDVYPDNVVFHVPELKPRRESFSPDAAYHRGDDPDNPDDAVPGAPAFAVEVRSKDDHGRAAETAMAAKRADYFEAGTSVVWDVDPVTETVTVYRQSGGDPTACRRGQYADAEPALPGWRMAVDEVFGPRE